MGATRKPTPLFGAVVALAAGCTGTSTDNPYEGGEHAGGGSQCEPRRVVALELDEQSELGFSANEVLAHLHGTHEEQLAWQPLSHSSYGPESGTQELTLTVASTGRARFVDYEPKTGGFELAAQCEDQVEVPVEVSLQTAQGALDEEFTATLTARSEARARIYHRRKAADISGTLTLTSSDGFTLSELYIDIEGTRFGIAGNITPSLEKRSSDTVAHAPSKAIATWGPSGCEERGGTAVPRDAAIRGFSAEDALTQLSQRAQASAHWRGGDDTNVTLTFVPDIEGACAVLEESDSEFPGGGGPLGSLHIPATLMVTSADGSYDGSVGGLLVALPDDAGELESITFDGSAAISLDASGFTGVDLSAYDSASVRALISLGSASNWSGSVTLVGYDAPICSAEPEQSPEGGSSVPGCPGAEPHEVAELVLGE